MSARQRKHHKSDSMTVRGESAHATVSMGCLMGGRVTLSCLWLTTVQRRETTAITITVLRQSEIQSEHKYAKEKTLSSLVKLETSGLSNMRPCCWLQCFVSEDKRPGASHWILSPISSLSASSLDRLESSDWSFPRLNDRLIRFLQARRVMRNLGWVTWVTGLKFRLIRV